MKHLLQQMVLTAPSAVLLSNSPRVEDQNAPSERTQSQETSRRTASRARKEQKLQARKQQKQKQKQKQIAPGQDPRDENTAGAVSIVKSKDEADLEADGWPDPVNESMLIPADPPFDQVLYRQSIDHLRNPMVARVLADDGSNATSAFHLPPLRPENRLGSSVPGSSTVPASSSTRHSSPARRKPLPQNLYSPGSSATDASQHGEHYSDSPPPSATTSNVGYQFTGYFF